MCVVVVVILDFEGRVCKERKEVKLAKMSMWYLCTFSYREFHRYESEVTLCVFHKLLSVSRRNFV